MGNNPYEKVPVKIRAEFWVQVPKHLEEEDIHDEAWDVLMEALRDSRFDGIEGLKVSFPSHNEIPTKKQRKDR